MFTLFSGSPGNEVNQTQLIWNTTYQQEYLRRNLASTTARYPWLDGVNIDLEEFPAPYNSTDLTSVICDVQAALHAKGLRLHSQDVDCWGTIADFNMTALSACMDFILPMCYCNAQSATIAGPTMELDVLQNDFVRHHDNISNKHRKIWLIDPQKIILGLPFFGYDFECTDAAPVPFPRHPEAGGPAPSCKLPLPPKWPMVDHFAVMQLYQSEVITSGPGRGYDPIKASAWFEYCHNTTGTRHQVWHEDPRAVRAKAQFAFDVGMRGVAYWRGNAIYGINDAQGTDINGTDSADAKAMWHAAAAAAAANDEGGYGGLGFHRVKHDDLVAESALLPFSDAFNRADGALNNGWVEGWAATKNYSKLGIFNHAVAVVAPTIRNGTYPPPSNDTCNVAIIPGEILAGIGCVWRETRSTSVTVSIRWSGLWGFPHHIEAAPLLHITPGTQSLGIGIWPAVLYDKPVFFIGTIGNPGCLFNPIDAAVFNHTDGTPREITAESNGAALRFFLDGSPIKLAKAGFASLPIPAELRGSTLHGFAVDTHCVSPYQSATRLPAITEFRIKTEDIHADGLPHSVVAQEAKHRSETRDAVSAAQPPVRLLDGGLKADDEEVSGNSRPTRTMTYWAGAPNMTLNGKPSCMLEFHPGGCTNWSHGAPAWQARLDNIAAHRQNVTGIVPALHAVVNGGLLGYNGDGSYQNFLPYLPKLKAMGLEVLAFLGNAGRPQQAALEAAIRRGPAFIQDAIVMAKRNGYDGYSWDHELHCKQDMRCWDGLKALEPPYMDFLNLFADTLHQHNLTLSVFIAGCCGFVDPAHDRSRVIGCVGAESTHDFCGTHCIDFTNSSVDRVIAGATYSGSWHDDPATGRRETWALKSLAVAGKSTVGVPMYGTGLKGGGFGPPVVNASLPNCSQSVPPLWCYGPFGDEGRAVMDFQHQIGIVHMAKFMDEPRTEQEWQAWGYHLHGPHVTVKADDEDAATAVLESRSNPGVVERPA